MDALGFASSLYLTDLGLPAIIGRLGLATLLGLIIGIDREYHATPAGLRTHMLVSLAAATFSILAMEIFARVDRSGGSGGDPIRAIEAVTAGVAFLAAGAIIQGRGQVHGLTTGAAMWLAGAIGLACGVGAYPIAVLATIFGTIILTLLKWVENRLPGRPEKRGRESQE